MATTLFLEWCLRHEVGEAKGYFDIHNEGSYFSWYKISKTLKRQITLSLGVASISTDVNSIDMLLEHADPALYMAK